MVCFGESYKFPETAWTGALKPPAPRQGPASALSAVAFLAVAFTATAFSKVNFLGSQFLNSIFFHSSCTSTTVSFLAVASTAATERFCSLARLNGTINYQRDPYAGLLEP